MSSSSGPMAEDRLLPPCILLTIVINVAAMCCNNWLEGHYGDVCVTVVSPWSLCNIQCLTCLSSRPHLDCFWMDDWANTGYDMLGVVSHLEYWVLGALVLSVIPALAVCVGSACQRQHCGIDLRRPAMLLLIVAASLSTLSLALFASKLTEDMSQISNYKDLTSHAGWPLYLRAGASVAMWLCAGIAVVQECRLRRAAESAGADAAYTVVTQSRSMDDLLDDENEEDGELL